MRVTDVGECDTEIRRHIRREKNAFYKLSEILRNRTNSLKNNYNNAQQLCNIKPYI